MIRVCLRILALMEWKMQRTKSEMYEQEKWEMGNEKRSDVDIRPRETRR